ncbi:MAG: septal ring lytic transglycosylase RlpA family protein [Desulfovibrionaceae bacterium]|nr:septal ring lytic transglycosylase RlpA family protein [Desulfovibrionaceae bacterium]
MQRSSRSTGAAVRLAVVLFVFFAALAAGCAKKAIYPGPEPTAPTAPSTTPYTVKGETYHPMGTAQGYAEEGLASWYGQDFHGKRTASGEVYDMHAMTAAHKLLPFGTRVRVTNLENGQAVEVRINDRGPFIKGRIIDLSREAGERIGLAGPGVARVRVQTVGRVSGLVAGELGGAFYVQVGSFGVRENADSLRAKLIEKGYTEGRVQPAVVGGKDFWRVQAGPYTGLNAALKAQQTLEEEYPSSFVIAD